MFHPRKHLRISKIWTLIRNSRWTFDAEQLWIVVWVLYMCVSAFSNSKSSLLYIEMWKIHWKLPAHQKESFETWSKSPMIFCLIWLLSYEGSISNSFQVWRDTGGGIAVFLVLLQGQNWVVEIVVIQFVQLSFVNSLQRKSIQCLQIHLN